MKEILLESLKVAIPLAIYTLAYAVIVLVKRHLVKKGADIAERAAIDAACATTKGILDQMLFGAVTAAEREWGSGTGAVKLDLVREKILMLLPETIRGLVPTDWLKRMIEAELDEAKRYWSTDPWLISDKEE